MSAAADLLPSLNSFVDDISPGATSTDLRELPQVKPS